MSEYREFQGKTLDDAIKNACVFYDVPREKLEVEIINDAAGGIFGLVVSRKASIRARRIDFDNLRTVFEDVSETKSISSQVSIVAAEAASSIAQEETTDRLRENGGEDRRDSFKNNRREKKNAYTGQRPAKDSHKKKQPDNAQNAAAPEAAAPAPLPSIDPLQKPVDCESHDDLPKVPFELLEKEQLQAVARDVVQRLASFLLENFVCHVTFSSDRVHVSIATEEDPGLIIGRDGQTLAAIQYLAIRLVSNKMQAMVRVQVDIAEYRQRQDERLRELACVLAEKVKKSGRSQLTRPLASYHRRVIHVALHDDPLIQTHSKGEGELKRVVIALRRKSQN